MTNIKATNNRKSLLDSLLKSPALFFFSKTFILPRLNGGKAVFSKKVIWKNQVRREEKKEKKSH